MRIDAHQHFWRHDPAEYAWIDESMLCLRRDFLPEEAKREMAAAGFDACVAVQARQTPEETRWLLGLADEHPFIAGVVGWVDLQSSDVGAALAEASRHPKLVGVRHIVQSEPDDFLLGAAFQRGVAMLAGFDLAYDVLVYERHLPTVIDFVDRFPGQRFVLDHLGKPDVRGGRIEGWRQHLRRLARFPNVWCKLSGLVTEADWNAWTPGQLRPYVEIAAECFGAGRLMIGSDWPVCTLAGGYARAIEPVLDCIAGWPAHDRDAVLGDTARRFWNLPVLETPA
jgi:L-fuconolactonase